MSIIQKVIQHISATYSNGNISTAIILSVLLMVLVISIYEFIVYRLISHRSLYNKSFNISLAILPFFIATIILCLQSNMVITLGTIGALAIIRYRTAIKDPVDMIYILWSIHTGIICGCQLYEVAVLTSLLVTILLFLLDHLKPGKLPFILVINTQRDEGEKIEESIISILKGYTSFYKFKSRNYSENEINFTIELSLKSPGSLAEKLRNTHGIIRFSIIQYDSEDIL